MRMKRKLLGLVAAVCAISACAESAKKAPSVPAAIEGEGGRSGGRVEAGRGGAEAMNGFGGSAIGVGGRTGMGGSVGSGGMTAGGSGGTTGIAGSAMGSGGAGGRLDGGTGDAVRRDGAADQTTATRDGPAPGGMVSFQRDIVPLVVKTCGVTGCHIAGSPQAHGMDLVSADKIHKGWVNVKGFDHCNEDKGGVAEFPPRITPSKIGDRESYILVKVRNTVGLCGTTSQRMPLPPAGAWTAAEVETLRQWILQGAQNN